MYRSMVDIIESARSNIDEAISEVKAMISANGGEGVSHWSAFILCSCIIDYLAGYRYTGVEAHGSDRYKRFIREYLNHASAGHHYDEDDIYHWLRCGMVHGYTDMYNHQTKFLFTHLFPGEHLKQKQFRVFTGETGVRTVIRLQDFLDDIKESGDLLFEDAVNADTDSEIITSMEKRVNEVGVKRSDFQIMG